MSEKTHEWKQVCRCCGIERYGRAGSGFVFYEYLVDGVWTKVRPACQPEPGGATWRDATALDGGPALDCKAGGGPRGPCIYKAGHPGLHSDGWRTWNDQKTTSRRKK